ncbi:MAG: hypothetical protein ACTH2I_12185 [Staphylococcus equorum]|uniref:hypothetical protein n=1 Tax=Staphylococcus equorum TaxID=246432 RepID=UPI001F22E53D|nr:hypothetical protein [Staphylococcus equorum]MDK9842440.1 hypothetical protein [Staphylococcus equorum]
MTKKKFTYKVPSMVALTLAGTALTSHQAQAADDVQNKSTNENVLDDKNTLKQSEQIKSELVNLPLIFQVHNHTKTLHKLNRP